MRIYIAKRSVRLRKVRVKSRDELRACGGIKIPPHTRTNDIVTNVGPAFIHDYGQDIAIDCRIIHDIKWYDFPHVDDTLR